MGQEDVVAGANPLPGGPAGTRLSGVPDRKLRSNFTPGSTPWAMRRAQWSALGLSDEDLEKPKIAIVNSSSQLASCFSHLDEIVAPLKKAIEDAGGQYIRADANLKHAPADPVSCLNSCLAPLAEHAAKHEVVNRSPAVVCLFDRGAVEVQLPAILQLQDF